MKVFWRWLGDPGNSRALGLVLTSLALIAATSIGFLQISINNNLLAVNYEPSLRVDYESPSSEGADGLRYTNNGKTTLTFYQRSINQSLENIVVANDKPTPIPPGQSIFGKGEDLLAHWSVMMGTSTSKTFPFLVFFKTADSRKYVLDTNLHMVRNGNKMMISWEQETYKQYNWPER